MTHDGQEKARDHTISRRTFVVRLSGLLGASAVGSVLASCQSLAQQPVAPSSPTAVPTATSHPTTPGTTLYVYHGHSSAVSDLSWSPDSNAIASASGGFLFGADENAVHVWNAKTGATTFILQNPPHGTPPTVAWSPDGTRIAGSQYGSSNGYSQSFRVAIWNAHTGHLEIVYTKPTSIFAIAWSPDSTRIASAWDSDVEIFNATTGHEVVSYPTSLPPNISRGSHVVAWSPDGETIVSAAAKAGHSVQFWNANTGQPLHYFSGLPVITVEWSPNGKLVAIQTFGSSMESGLVEVRNAITGQVLLSYTNIFVPTPGREQTVFGYIRPHNITWSPDSRYIAVPNHVTTVELWDVTKQRLAYTYRGHTSIVYAVAWSPDGTRIASASNDKTVRVWQAI